MVIVNKSIKLKLRLGELTFAKLSLDVAVMHTKLFGEQIEYDLEACTQMQLPPKLAGVYLPSARISEQLPKFVIRGKKIIYVPQKYPRYFIDFNLGYDAYLQTFSAKSRSSVRRKVRRFAKDTGGEIDWKVYKTPSELADFYHLALPLSKQTYQHKMFNAGLPDSDTFRDEMCALAENDSVRAYLIFDNEHPVAFLYCPIKDGAVQYSFLGYLDEVRNASPGTVLLWLVLEDLFQEGKFNAFDFTAGGIADGHSQKGFFSTGHVECGDIFILKASPANITKIFSAISTDRLSSGIGSILERLHIKGAIRRLVRMLK